MGLILFVGAAAAAYWGWRFFAAQSATATTTASQPRRPATPVIAKSAQRGDLPIYLDGVGTVQALNMVTIHSRVDGELDRVLFEEGQFVHKGDLIAEIDPRAYQVQLSQAQAQQAKDQAALDNAKRDYQRYETAREAVPQQQLDTAASMVSQFEAAIKIDQSVIDNANLLLSYTKITAPISGRMGLRQIDAGNLVHASDPNGLAVITQVQPIAVVFTLSQGDLPQVQRAMKGEATTSASAPGSAPGTVPANGSAAVKVLAYDTTLTNLLANGNLAALDNQIDITSGTFKAKGLFDNLDNTLFPNQFVNVRLLVETRKNVVLVPAEAIQRSPQSTFVDVINDDQTVDQRNVKVGPTEAGKTIVEEGLQGDEMVATSGLDRLEPGAKVTIQSATSHAETRSGSQTGAAGSSPGSRSGKRGRGTASAPATTLESGGPASGEGGVGEGVQ